MEVLAAALARLPRRPWPLPAASKRLPIRPCGLSSVSAPIAAGFAAGIAPLTLGARSHGVVLHCEEVGDRKPDALRHVVRKSLALPEEAFQVMAVARDVGRWCEFMPCCSESRYLGLSENGSQLFEVRFGMSLGRIFVGDIVVYEATRKPGVLELRSVNNSELKYVDEILCRVTAVNVVGGSEIDVELNFRARNGFYLSVWERIEEPLVEMIAARLKFRALTLSNSNLASYPADIVCLQVSRLG